MLKGGIAPDAQNSCEHAITGDLAWNIAVIHLVDEAMGSKKLHVVRVGKWFFDDLKNTVQIGLAQLLELLGPGPNPSLTGQVV